MHAKTHGTAFMYNRERMSESPVPNPADTGAAVKAKQRNLLIGSFYQKAGKLPSAYWDRIRNLFFKTMNCFATSSSSKSS